MNHIFSFPMRLLHWATAVIVLAMLAIGFAMTTSLADYHFLVSLHRPLGVILFLLVAIRLTVRLFSKVPPVPAGMPGWQRTLASLSHVLLYILLFAMPLVGWGMLSAAAYPVTLFGPLTLPAFLPHDITLFSILRTTHTVLACALGAVIALHVAAALTHALIFRDSVFQSMATATLRRKVAPDKVGGS